ncbi:hypothetical protein PV327_000599 [Microctonus hyperodae]|uniref:Uncharacterized protein n=1 Tax=Microctonus hyperodae TaxID=165561 RepID=A0AA39G6U5_MICHY|nr:hypothetical protein PV327_000599 [Microctonus hyperodae]
MNTREVFWGNTYCLYRGARGKPWEPGQDGADLESDIDIDTCCDKVSRHRYLDGRGSGNDVADENLSAIQIAPPDSWGGRWGRHCWTQECEVLAICHEEEKMPQYEDEEGN